METLWKCAAVCIVASVMGLLLKKYVPEQALLVGILTTVILFGSAITLWTGILGFLEEISKRASLSGSLTTPVVKGLGLALVGGLAEDICKDAGQSGSASAMQIITTAAILYISLPLLRLLADAVFSYV